jgi:hypothetical protein
MEKQTIIISEQDRILLSKYMDEKYSSLELDFNTLMPIVKRCFKKDRNMFIQDLNVTIFATANIEAVWQSVIKCIKRYFMYVAFL